MSDKDTTACLSTVSVQVMTLTVAKEIRDRLKCNTNQPKAENRCTSCMNFIGSINTKREVGGATQNSKRDKAATTTWLLFLLLQLLLLLLLMMVLVGDDSDGGSDEVGEVSDGKGRQGREGSQVKIT